MKYHAKFNAAMDAAIKTDVPTLREKARWQPELAVKLLRVYTKEQVQQIFKVFKKVTGATQAIVNFDAWVAKPEVIVFNTIMCMKIDGVEKSVVLAQGDKLWQVTPLLEQGGFKFRAEYGCAHISEVHPPP